MNKTSVYENLLQKSKTNKLCLPLLDPVNFLDEEKLSNVINKINKDLVDAFLVGGSTLVSQEDLDQIITRLKSLADKPVIIFPNNVSSISKKADAILYMMLMNSNTTYYLIEAQMLASPLIERYGLETISTGYVVINSDSAVSHIGHARAIPNIPELVGLYVLAAKHFGFKVVYLEGGSGTSSPLNGRLVKYCKDLFPGLLLVGGGITNPMRAKEIADNGADGIVIGNLLEMQEGSEKFNEICRTIKKPL